MAGMPPRARRQYATLRTRQSKVRRRSMNRGGGWMRRGRPSGTSRQTRSAAYREMPAYEDTEAFDVAGVQARAFGPTG